MQIVSNERWLELAASAGELSFFRFGYTPTSETTVWGQRTIPQQLLYFCTHGGFEVVLKNKCITMNRGGFIWLMPGVEHETRLLHNRRPFRTYFMRVDLRTKDGVSARMREDVFAFEEAWNLLPPLRDLVQELQSPQSYHEQRVRAMMVILTAAVIGPPAAPSRAVLSTPQRERLRRYMERRATSRVTPNELAEELGLSPRYFRSIFHRSFGMSPMHWIVRQRILVAAMLLAGTELQAKEVAYQLGYCDRFLFSRQFKQVMGVSPLHFRRGSGSAPAWELVDADLSGAPPVRRAIDWAAGRLRRVRARNLERDLLDP